jgi:hypothetical protein
VSYARSVGAASLAELRRMPARDLLKGQQGRIAHPVIEPYVLPLSPHDAYAAGRLNDVPVLIGSNAEEANSVADLSQVKAASFAEDMKRAWGPVPPQLWQAYPFSNDAEARAARAGFERDLRFGWDMWTWARLQAKRGRAPAYYYRFCAATTLSGGVGAGGMGRQSFRRDVVHVRSSRSGALGLDRRRPAAGRYDGALLGEFRAQRRSQWRRLGRLACLSGRGRAGADPGCAHIDGHGAGRPAAHPVRHCL